MDQVKNTRRKKCQETDPSDRPKAILDTPENFKALRLRRPSPNGRSQYQPEKQHPANPGDGGNQMDPHDKGWGEHQLFLTHPLPVMKVPLQGHHNASIS